MHPVIGHTIDQLSNLATPNRGIDGNMEAFRATIYDTQVYTAGTTTSLTFFTTAYQGDAYLSNMPAAGQLPNPEFFALYNVYLDILGDPPADKLLWEDYSNLLFGTGALGAPYAVLNYAGRQFPAYGGYPLSLFGSSGGVTGEAGTAVVNIDTIANNGIPGVSPFDFGQDEAGDATILLLPLKAFNWQLRWSAAVALPSGAASVQLRLTMDGTYYREAR